MIKYVCDACGIEFDNYKPYYSCDIVCHDSGSCYVGPTDREYFVCPECSKVIKRMFERPVRGEEDQNG